MAGTLDTTSQKIHDWRIEVFTRLGFGPEDAEMLAETRQEDGFLIDTEQVRRLVRLGCSLALVKRIVL